MNGRTHHDSFARTVAIATYTFGRTAGDLNHGVQFTSFPLFPGVTKEPGDARRKHGEAQQNPRGTGAGGKGDVITIIVLALKYRRREKILAYIPVHISPPIISRPPY